MIFNWNKVIKVKTLHNLSHPSIIKFYNWYETKNHLWMVYEYCSGGDLFSLMEIDKTVYS